jgi:hypothetical protein
VGAVVGAAAAFPQHFCQKQSKVLLGTLNDSNDVTGGREEWKKLGVPAG